MPKRIETDPHLKQKLYTVWRMWLEGAKEYEIAEAIGLSVRQVRNYKKRIREMNPELFKKPHIEAYLLEEALRLVHRGDMSDARKLAEITKLLSVLLPRKIDKKSKIVRVVFGKPPEEEQ